MAVNAKGQVYTINGVKVHFPVKAYPSQLSMMDKIIKGIERKQNCLLESPTGSGKSLALLCAALAWQNQEYEKAKAEAESSKTPDSGCCCQCGQLDGANNNEAPSSNMASTTPAPVEKPPDPDILDEEEDDDFKPLAKKLKGLMATRRSEPTAVSYEHDQGGQSAAKWTMERNPSAVADSGGCCSCQCESEEKPKRKVPRIYFGTRTHKQIAQIARELGKTAYRNVKMCILSSREHTCIDPEVSSMPSGKKNEECKNKRDGPGCRFHDHVRKISQRNIKTHGLDSAWDLEDFVSFCRKYKACPYFGARQLKDNADIVFSPYNYLIDPGIRNSMDIVLKENVVILDEAHNIEDSARDAASYQLTQKALQDASQDIRNLITAEVKPIEHGILLTLCNNLTELMERIGTQLEGADFDQASKVWHGMEMVALLTQAGMGPTDGERITKAFLAVCEEEDPEENYGSKAMIHSPTKQMLEGLLLVLQFIFKENMQYMEDYRMVLVKTLTYGNVGGDTDGKWLSKRKRGRRAMEWMYTLHFWCLNPAVAFSDIGGAVRSVIVTSGTLAPLNTFQSELGSAFPIQLEANHVIGRDQVWVGTISRGPRGGVLLGSYQNTETFSYQDEIGTLVLQVCQTMPHGVLCFLSSYKMMDKLATRWKDTGLWTEIEKSKVILCEPRRGDQEDFDTLIKRFYGIIQESEQTDNQEGGVTGALFLAVCRGKVSEGIDFADNNARAVITIGIPFPNIKDSLVELKRQYNNKYCASRGLLSGSAWYEIQAFRAINQALGRCIRHRHDWGALILVDERFAKNPNKYIKGLSKWVRQRVQYYSNFQQAQTSLREYTQRLQAGQGMDSSILSQSNTSTILDSSVAVTPRKPDKLFPLFNIPTFKGTPGPGTPGNIIQSPITGMSALKETVNAGQTTPDSSLFLVPQVNNLPERSRQVLEIQQPQQIVVPANIPGEHILSQMAGGFLVSQTEAKQTQSTTQNPEESIISAPSDDTNHLDDLNPNQLDFNPAFASTQMSQKPSPRNNFYHQNSETLMNVECSTPNRLAISSRGSRQENRQSLIDHDNNYKPVTPKQEGFQMASNVLKSLAHVEDTIKTEQASGNNATLSLSDKLRRYSFNGTSSNQVSQKTNSENLDSRTPLSRPSKRDSTSFYEFVNINQASKVEKREELQSNSPPLFDDSQSPDSAPMSMDPQRVDAVVGQIGEDPKDHVHETVKENNDSGTMMVKRPLFKCSNRSDQNKNGIAEDSICHENGSTALVDLKVNEQQNDLKDIRDIEDFRTSTQARKPFRNKLSRQSSMNSTLNCSKDFSGLGTSLEENKGKEDSVSSQCNERKNTKSTKARLKSVPKGVVFDGEETGEGVVLNTRRSKRRRQESQRTTPSKKNFVAGKDLVDELNHIGKSANQQDTRQSGTCKKCGFRILKSTAVIDHPKYNVPQFLHQNLKVELEDKSSVWWVTSKEELAADCIYKTTFQLKDMVLNSYWSEVDGCCVQYLVCPQCNSQGAGSSQVIGIQVVVTAPSCKPNVKIGQVWLLEDRVNIKS